MSTAADDLSMFEDDAELLEMFVSNAADLLGQIEADLLLVEQMGANVDDNLINKVFRAAHTIKGESGFVGLHNVGELAHSIENVLDAVRNRQLVPTHGIVSRLLDAFDLLGSMTADISSSPTIDISHCVESMQRILGPDETDNSPAQVDSANARPVSVLMIDNDDRHTSLTSGQLVSNGLNCHVAVDGESGLAMMRDNLYRVVICEINLPTMGGLDLIPLLKGISPMVQVIVLTSDANSANIIDSLGRGAIDFICKTDQNSGTRLMQSVTEALTRCENWASCLCRR